MLLPFAALHSPFAYELNPEFSNQIIWKAFKVFSKFIFISTNDKSFFAIFDFSFSRSDSKAISMFIWVQKFFCECVHKIQF